MLPHVIVALDFGTECEYPPTNRFHVSFHGEQSSLHLVLSSADRTLVPGTYSHESSICHSSAKRTTTVRRRDDDMADNFRPSAANCRYQDGQLLAIWDGSYLGRAGHVLQIDIRVVQAGPARRQIPDICAW